MKDENLKAVAHALWTGMHPDERTLRAFVAILDQHGHKISRGTAHYWVREWGAKAPKTMPVAYDGNELTVEPIPQVLLDAVGPRAAVVLNSRSLQAAELALEALTKKVGAIACKAADGLEKRGGSVTRIDKSEDGSVETKELSEREVAREVIRDFRHVFALQSILAGVKIAAAQSEALYGNADKAKAEAQAILASVRAENAKEITPINGGEVYDGPAEDEAMAALMEVERKK